MKYEIDLPPLAHNGVEYEPTGEYRAPNPFEPFLSEDRVHPGDSAFRSQLRIILRCKTTIAERLEQLRSGPPNYGDWAAKFDSVIADVRKLEGSK